MGAEGQEAGWAGICVAQQVWLRRGVDELEVVDSLVLPSVLWEADDSIVSTPRSWGWDCRCKSVTCCVGTRVLF